MSLLNVWLSPSRAVVCVDTKSSTLDREHFGESSKMALAPHSGVIVAVNGYALALRSLFAWLCNNSQDDTSIDGISDWMSGQLNDPEIKAGIDAAGLVAVFVGYSKRTKKYRGIRIAKHDSTDFSAKEISPYMLLPGDPWPATALPVPDNRYACLNIARRQVEWARKNHPGEPIGGRLLMAEVSQKEAKIYEAGLLG